MSSCDAVIISISGAVKKRWAFTPHTLPSLLSHGNLYNLDEFSYTDSQVAYSQSLNRLILFVVFVSHLPPYISRISHRVFPLPDCQGARFYLPLLGLVYGPMCVPCVPCVPKFVPCNPTYIFFNDSRKISEPPTLTFIIPL